MSASEKYSIAIVGLHFGAHIVELLKKAPAKDLFTLSAVCDLDHARADKVAQAQGVKVCYALEEVLADPAIQVVGLFTGPNGRAELIRKIIRAGKHVLTTKPFEVNSQAALDVLNEARQLGRVVHLNSPAPVPTPDLAIIREWQEKHQLGRLVAARAEAWAPYFEKADGSWYDDPKRCPLAPIFRIGIYLINDVVWLLGEPKQVNVLQTRIRTGRPTADNAQLGIEFANGAIANVFASFCIGDGDYYRNGLVVNFEHGTIYRNCGPQKSGAVSELSLVKGDRTKRECVEKAEFADASGLYQWEALHRAIRGEKLTEELSPDQIVAGVRVIEGIVKAIENGGVAETR